MAERSLRTGAAIQALSQDTPVRRVRPTLRCLVEDIGDPVPPAESATLEDLEGSLFTRIGELALIHPREQSRVQAVRGAESFACRTPAATLRRGWIQSATFSGSVPLATHSKESAQAASHNSSSKVDCCPGQTIGFACMTKGL